MTKPFNLPRAKVVVCPTTYENPQVVPDARSRPLYSAQEVLEQLALWKRTCPRHRLHRVVDCFVRADGSTILITATETAA